MQLQNCLAQSKYRHILHSEQICLGITWSYLMKLKKLGEIWKTNL
jgi:hypothetical protein